MSPALSVAPVNKSRDENQELDNAVPTVDAKCVDTAPKSFVPSAACTERPLLERLEHVSVPSTNEGMSLCKSPETLAPSVASVNRSLERTRNQIM
ncbi:hypothetical protein Pcinc_037952 [Petrolisthes cinctipes]|uniref:Uncharacterized protein n=1 Tax=Petrolisthes cinctipes TaxID=88211 RepID=A0AAE1BRK5_PETCI|nr:hypothetical protein Pcinc_037952 [Petrolisthes cinctipes]